MQDKTKWSFHTRPCKIATINNLQSRTATNFKVKRTSSTWLRLLAGQYSLPYDFAAFDHQPTTEEVITFQEATSVCTTQYVSATPATPLQHHLSHRQAQVPCGYNYLATRPGKQQTAMYVTNTRLLFLCVQHKTKHHCRRWEGRGIFGSEHSLAATVLLIYLKPLVHWKHRKCN